MDVRAARADDVPALAAGTKEVAAEDRWLATEPGADTQGLEAMFEESVASENINLVLDDAGMVVGAIGGFPRETFAVCGAEGCGSGSPGAAAAGGASTGSGGSRRRAKATDSCG